ncbi:MAG: toprim domain-containing protein, partial [bacterium]
MKLLRPGIDPARLENVRTSNGKTTARCPACAETGNDTGGDHLFIAEDGKFGCIKFPGTEGGVHRKRIYALAGPLSAQEPAPSKSAFETLDAAVAGCCPQGATLVDTYEYPRSGQPFGAVARYKTTNGKSFRQFRATGGGWEPKAPAGKWPLFNADKLPAEGTIYVVEGEKCALATAKIGLTAVTSAGGASAAGKSDWTPLSGRDVVIIPDNDKAGESYADTVARILACLPTPARVRLVKLPVANAGDDLIDFLAAGGTVDQLKALVLAAPAWASPAGEQVPSCTAPASAKEIRAKLWEITRIPNLSATEHYRQSAAAVVEWLHARGRFYYHVERRDFASVMFFDATQKLLRPVQGDAFLAWLSDMLTINRSETAFKFVQAAIETEGLSERSTGIKPATFWAATPTVFYLSSGPGRMARMSAGRVEIVDNGT